MRRQGDVVRGPRLSLVVDGRAVEAFEGETLATIMLAADVQTFRTDTWGRPRGLFCNMGVCSECLVDVVHQDQAARRVRACMTPAASGMSVSTTRGGA